jgi:hypothetical protein
VTLPWRGGLAAVAAVVLTAGCSVFTKPAQSPPCPRVLLVPGFDEASAWRAGPGRDPTDLRYRLQIADAQGTCRYDKDALSVELTVRILAERGPAAAEGGPADLEYFVALADPQENILNKAVFKVRVNLPAGQTRASFPDEIQMPRIPLARRDAGPDYSILLGFQLSPEEAARNRRRAP